MIGSHEEFDDSTAFERWALEGLVPLSVAQPHAAVKDIENKAVRVMARTAVVRVYAGGVREVHVDLRPLAFGAAWKVLDLLVELALSQAGFPSAGRVTITEKIKQARTAAGQCPPLTGDAAVWRTLTGTYAGTEEIRHSLAHRHAEVDRSSGELTGRDRHGNQLPPISAAQQEAFCRAVVRSAHATLTGLLTPRERSDLAWNLDQLSHLHGQQPLEGDEMAPAPLGIARARMSGGSVLVDASAILTELRASFPDRSTYDATFELSDGRHLLVELEQAPQHEVAVDPASPPSWAVPADAGLRLLVGTVIKIAPHRPESPRKFGRVHQPDTPRGLEAPIAGSVIQAPRLPRGVRSRTTVTQRRLCGWRQEDHRQEGGFGRVRRAAGQAHQCEVEVVGSERA